MNGFLFNFRNYTYIDLEKTLNITAKSSKKTDNKDNSVELFV